MAIDILQLIKDYGSFVLGVVMIALSNWSIYLLYAGIFILGFGLGYFLRGESKDDEDVEFDDRSSEPEIVDTKTEPHVYEDVKYIVTVQFFDDGSYGFHIGKPMCDDCDSDLSVKRLATGKWKYECVDDCEWIWNYTHEDYNEYMERVDQYINQQITHKHKKRIKKGRRLE